MPAPDLSRSFVRDEIAQVRHKVAECAAEAGLDGARLDGFVLAVNEIVTNAVQHGGGAGRLQLWQLNGLVRCDVIDHGRGFPVDHPVGQELPTNTATGGRGLWLARAMCDDFVIDTGRHGTTVRLAIAAPRPRPPG